ncbi:hypothetical protein V2J09_008533 [Rumex salicifolius]
MESKKRSLIFSIGLTLLLSCFRPSNGCCAGKRERGFKGMFVFGSSVVDNGNNNHLVGSSAKSNYKPYGVDFPSGPTGRFTNGKTIADFVADHLGIPLVPAFWDPKTKGYGDVHGVNYGSGGSGILDGTGITSGAMSLNTQIKEFEKVTVPELEAAMRSTRHEILPEYLVMVAAGNNDYGFNYFLGQTPKVTPQAFTQSLICIYSQQLKSLYSVGARNFLLVTVYALGCNPWIREYTNTTNGCHQPSNLITRLFYTQLLQLVKRLNSDLPGSHFLLLDAHSIVTDIISNPLPKGFHNVAGSCCEQKISFGNVKIGCKEDGKVCANRHAYVFFDGQHYTEAVNSILASKAFHSSNNSQVYPFSLCQLARRIF